MLNACLVKFCKREAAPSVASLLLSVHALHLKRALRNFKSLKVKALLGKAFTFRLLKFASLTRTDVN